MCWPMYRKKNYEVDLVFYKKFINNSKKNKKYFSYKNQNKKLFNLRKFVADKLIKLKVKVDHVDKDTFAQKAIFLVTEGQEKQIKKITADVYLRFVCSNFINLKSYRNEV